ncbi:MAG: hypothetical protein RXR08_14685, partial [Sulfolobaceae archaeon]
EMDLITELKTKGFAELPFEVALIKIEGKCYAINVEALHDLEQGVEKWKDLETFLNKYGIIIPGEVEGLYVIPWKLLGRCNEWQSESQNTNQGVVGRAMERGVTK